MKGFLKFVLTVSALFAAAVGVLVLADQIINKRPEKILMNQFDRLL